MTPQPPARDDFSIYAARHIRFGLWTAVVYTALGFALEGLHAFKTQAYLAVPNETRRLMWTLAHSHGTLVALVHIAYGASLRSGEFGRRYLRSTWWLLAAAAILLPLGFFLGGVEFYAGDPGVGAALVPIGAAALLAGLVLAAVGAGGTAGPGEEADAPTARRRAR
jgi:hypothetical protein